MQNLVSFFLKAKMKLILKLVFRIHFLKYVNYSVMLRGTLSASILATAGNTTEKKRKLITPNC